MLALPSRAALLTCSGYGDHEFAVLLSNEIFGTAGGAAVRVLLLNLDHKLFRWFEIQANFAGWPVHWRRRFLNVLRSETNKLDAGNFSPGVTGLHHFIEFEGLWI